ncbi:MAG: T9SS type A sorting domain-containing protein, partial [Bacteroidota bacterium]
GDNSNLQTFSFDVVTDGISPFDPTTYLSMEVRLIRVNGGSNTLEQTISLSPTFATLGNASYSFNSLNFDVPSGDYEIHLAAQFSNGPVNVMIDVFNNGALQCMDVVPQTNTNNASGDCLVGRIACFSYMACHSVSIKANKFNSAASANISGGTGPYIISWTVTNGNTTYTYSNQASVPMQCGSWWYTATVTDLSTGCVVGFTQFLRRYCTGNQVGKGNREAAVSLKLSPNPISSGVLRIQYSLPSEIADAQIQIYDIQGRLVKTQLLDANAQEMKLRLDELSNGMYITKIIGDGSTISSDKLIINR